MDKDWTLDNTTVIPTERASATRDLNKTMAGKISSLLVRNDSTENDSAEEVRENLIQQKYDHTPSHFEPSCSPWDKGIL